MPTTAAVTARAIADAGIDRVFGLPGGEILVLIDELRRAGVDFVLMRHEANAGIAAAVYGKLRRQPGVVLTTLGPGAANLMLPLSSAYLDQEPLLAISAQIPAEFPDSHTHQLLPLRETYSPLCRYVDTLTGQNAAEAVRHALDECVRRPFGPAYLTLSAREAVKDAAGPYVDVAPGFSASARDRSARATTDAPKCEEREGGQPRDRGPQRAALQGADQGDALQHARELTALLAKATRPLVLIGLGIHSSNAQRIRRWVTDWNLPVAVTPKVKGIVDETSGNFVGVISGMAADGLMCDALAASDLLVGLGLDPVEVDKTWHAELPIHWLLESANVGGRFPSGAALVDHARLLDALVAERAPARWPAPFQGFQDKRRSLLNDRTESAGTMWPGDLIHALSSAVPTETIVTTDVGSHKYLFGQFWPSRQPETFWMSNGLSGMAYGLSAAVGAKLARPDVPVLAAVGDGGFSMNAQELETAERVGAPFVTVVLEDGSYSLIKLAQEGRKLQRYRMDFGRIDTVKMAEACGVQGLRTSNPDELASAVKVAVERRRSLVVGVPVNYEDYRRLF
jgi:acetolactate synthase-1/2/3 large subunit